MKALRRRIDVMDIFQAKAFIFKDKEQGIGGKHLPNDTVVWGSRQPSFFPYEFLPQAK